MTMICRNYTKNKSPSKQFYHLHPIRSILRVVMQFKLNLTPARPREFCYFYAKSACKMWSGVPIIISTNPESCNLAVYLGSARNARARMIELGHVTACNCRGAGPLTCHDPGGSKLS